MWGLDAEQRRGLYTVSDSIAFAEFPDGQNGSSPPPSPSLSNTMTVTSQRHIRDSLGYFALKPIAAGELILSERPLRLDTRRDLPALARLILATPALGALSARPTPLQRSPEQGITDEAWTHALSQVAHFSVHFKTERNEMNSCC
jgi:hypothetical protein